MRFGWGRKKPAAGHPERRSFCRFDESVDELLEQAWMMEEEEGIKSVSELALRLGSGFPTHFAAAVDSGLIEVSGDYFHLTAQGKDRARIVVRAHRLAEMLLTEVLEMDIAIAESDACRFEHVMSPEAVDSICTLLGHPPTCPHGKPIPRGSCCERSRTEVSPIIIPMSELNPGDMARIVFMAPRSHARLDRLAAYGIVPGGVIRLHQKSPAFVVKIGETDVAVDSSVAGEIFVKRV